MAACGDLQQGKTGAVTSRLQEAVTHLALLVTGATVIELDGADKREIGGMAQQVIKMPAPYLACVLLPFALAKGGLWRQHIGHRYLGKDPGLFPCRLFQHGEKGPFGGV